MVDCGLRIADLELAGDLLAAPVDVLVNEWFLFLNLNVSDLDNQVPSVVDVDLVGAGEGELNLTRVRARGGDEVVLELTVIAIVGQVDARVDIVVLHPTEPRNVPVPLGG